MRVRILDWNVWDDNPVAPKNIADFIFSHNADIICLQEISVPVLEAVRARAASSYECTVARDVRHKGGDVCFLAVLSRLPIVKWRAIRAKRKRGWRSFFSSLWHNIEEHLESLRVDILVGRRRFRILNMHLEVGTGPKNRIQQFLHILRHSVRRRVVRNTIIIGDLNIYGQGWYERFVGWLWFGLRSVELLIDEREEFERIFKNRGLRNVFAGATTFSTGGVPFQFDHILVPEHIRVISQKVLSDNCGSDHYPICAEIETEIEI